MEDPVAPIHGGPRPPGRTDGPGPLTRREREIVTLIAQGYRNKETAERLFISERTVKNHLHNIFTKLGVGDRLELALYAVHNGLHNLGNIGIGNTTVAAS